MNFFPNIFNLVEIYVFCTKLCKATYPFKDNYLNVQNSL